MSTPWIEAWKAWLARVAEAFGRRSGPQPPSVQRVSHRPKSAATEQRSPTSKASLRRSGQRHG